MDDRACEFKKAIKEKDWNAAAYVFINEQKEHIKLLPDIVNDPKLKAVLLERVVAHSVAVDSMLDALNPVRDNFNAISEEPIRGFHEERSNHGKQGNCC